MASLTKIQKAVFEYDLGTSDVDETNDTVAVISKDDLGLPGGDFPITGTNRNVVYFLNIKALFVTADWSYDMVKTLDVMIQFSGTEDVGANTLYVNPQTHAQVAAANTIARLHDAWEIYVAGRTADGGPIPGSPTITDGAINIIANKSTAQILGGNLVKLKLFVDIYAHADNTL